jgi:crotonobetainyl-CoA:carnitine CoA-transferase CaiB-like acyl-CoA transferase
MVDFMTGVTTSLGLLAALLGAGRTGQGCDVDVSLFDVALHQLSYPATWYLNEGHKTERMPRSAHPSTVPCQLYKTADGWLFAMAMTPKFWTLMLEGLGREELGEDERFANVAARREYRDQLTEILDQAFSADTTAHWLQVFKGKVPMAPVYQLDQALNNPYLQQIGMIQSLQHPQRDNFKVLSNPIKINGERMTGKVCGVMGAETDELLAELKQGEEGR